MNVLSTIVVATDFSAHANRAVKRAARLAHEHEAALHLLFVLERHPLEILRNLIALGSDATEDMLLASVNSRMRELAELLHSRYGVPAQFRVAEGTSYVEIVAEVANEGADLLVIGAHGEHYLQDMCFYPDLVVVGRRGEAAEVEVLLGSVTKHIVYEAGCDVLVVP